MGWFIVCGDNIYNPPYPPYPPLGKVEPNIFEKVEPNIFEKVEPNPIHLSLRSKKVELKLRFTNGASLYQRCFALPTVLR